MLQQAEDDQTSNIRAQYAVETGFLLFVYDLDSRLNPIRLRAVTCVTGGAGVETGRGAGICDTTPVNRDALKC